MIADDIALYTLIDERHIVNVQVRLIIRVIRRLFVFIHVYSINIDSTYFLSFHLRQANLMRYIFYIGFLFSFENLFIENSDSADFGQNG